MNYLDLFGYLASLVILISLTMSSIVKLRWINAVGGALFTVYGLWLHSMPTAFLNFGIVVIDIYYLVKLYKRKESFKLVEANKDSELLNYFYETNKKELFEYFGKDKFDGTRAFFMLRDNHTSGILVGNENNGEFTIDVDFVTAEYRDFKLGQYFFNENTEELKKRGFKKVLSKPIHEKHREYLEKIGFKKVDKELFEKVL